jgi:hypothetical protein
MLKRLYPDRFGIRISLQPGPWQAQLMFVEPLLVCDDKIPRRLYTRSLHFSGPLFFEWTYLEVSVNAFPLVGLECLFDVWWKLWPLTVESV